ncbi:MAG: hypothetical protein C4344_01410, partial [Acidimicrobiia bacterium]
MRTEALVYAAVCTAVIATERGRRFRRLIPALVPAALVAIGFLLPVAANAALEKETLGGFLRSQRARSAALAALDGRSQEVVPSRAREAAVTTLAVQASLDNRTVIAGGLLVVLIGAGTVAALGRRAPPSRAIAPLVAAAALYGVVALRPPGFVPGFLVAAPLASAGLVAGWGRSFPRLVVVVALLALPLVWMFQFRGGAAPQWGGRYVLVSSLFLGVAGVVALARVPRWAL